MVALVFLLMPLTRLMKVRLDLVLCRQFLGLQWLVIMAILGLLSVFGERYGYWRILILL
ncbi:hypothetical protein D3C78_1597610 [compost metagenome]